MIIKDFFVNVIFNNVWIYVLVCVWDEIKVGECLLLNKKVMKLYNIVEEISKL